VPINIFLRIFKKLLRERAGTSRGNGREGKVSPLSREPNVGGLIPGP